MPILIEKQPDEPIITVLATSPIDFKTEIPPAMREFIAILDQAAEPVWDITEARNLPINFSEIVAVLGIISRADIGVVRHPKLAGIALIADNDLLRMGMRALGQAQYGSVQVKVFATLEEAFAFVRSTV